MKRTLTVLAALLALTGTATAQVVIPLPPIVVTPPPIVVTPPPVVVQPPPVIVAPPPVVLAPPLPPPPPVCVVVGPPWVWLNLRIFPNGPIVGALPPGTALALFNASGPWGFVQSPIGTGWAFLPYTTCN
jgi:hypothetical protein